MAKPKVFYLSTSLNLGGTEKNMETFISGLRDRYDFTVGYLKQNGLVGKRLAEAGIEVRKFGGLLELAGYLKKNRFDIVQTFLYRANIMGRIAGMMAGCPVVLSTQQSIDSWKNPFFAWLDGFTARRWCRLIIANSNTAKEVLCDREGIPPEKIRVVYNGIDAPKFEEAPGSGRGAAAPSGAERPVVVWTSRLHKEKGADLLPDIAAKVPKGSFVIAGDGPERYALETAVRLFGVEKRFSFLGWNQDVPGLLAASDLLLLPSREESFPLSVLEAMAAGLPVVAADVGGVRELVQDGKTGILVRKGDVQGFAAAVNRLAGDPALRKSMGESARKIARGFTESKMINSIDSVYSEFTRRQNAPQ